MITIKITDDIQNIQSKVNEACAKYLNEKIIKGKYRIMSACKRLASSWISSQPEMESLAGGFLAGAFGLYQGTEIQAVNAITTAISDSINVQVVKLNKNLRGGIFINFQPANFINLLSLSEGHVVYESGDLHWLQWLLERGDSSIVVNYSYSPSSGIGRSQKGAMSRGGVFRVPPEFSGTANNNFVTRALVGEAQEKDINREIINIFK